MLKLYSFHIQVFHLPLHGTLYTEVTHHLMHATSFMCKVKKKFPFLASDLSNSQGVPFPNFVWNLPSVLYYYISNSH